MSTAVLSKPATLAPAQKLPVGRVKAADSRIIVKTPTPLIAIRTSIKMSNVARLCTLTVPRGWTLVERLRDPDALLIYRALTPSQVRMIRCGAGSRKPQPLSPDAPARVKGKARPAGASVSLKYGCQAVATLRYGIFRSVNGKDVLRSSGMFACSVEHIGAHTTYRQDKPDASLYPLASFRKVKGSSIGRSSEGGAMPGRHAGGKSARKSRVVASMIDDGWD